MKNRIFRHSERDIINSLFESLEETNEGIKKQASKQKENNTLDKIAKEQKSKYVEDLNPILMNKNTILPSSRTSLTDKGYSYNTKTENAVNSIFDSSKLESYANNKSFGDKIKEEEASKKTNRKKAQKKLDKEYLDKAAEAVMDTNSIYKSLSSNASNNISKYENSLSMFDSDLDFSKLPEKSLGEKIRENKIASKDTTARETSRQKTASSLMDNLIENLLKNNE